MYYMSHLVIIKIEPIPDHGIYKKFNRSWGSRGSRKSFHTSRKNEQEKVVMYMLNNPDLN